MKNLLRKVHDILWIRFYESNDPELSPKYYQDAREFRAFCFTFEERQFKEQQEKWSRKYSKSILSLAEKIRRKEIQKNSNRRFCRFCGKLLVKLEYKLREDTESLFVYCDYTEDLIPSAAKFSCPECGKLLFTSGIDVINFFKK